MYNSFKIFSCHKEGDINRLIQIESVILSGLYKFSILGVNQKNISENKDRIYSALRTQNLTNLKSNNKKITINIVPGTNESLDSSCDISISLACLQSMGLFNIKEDIICTGYTTIKGNIISCKNIISIIHISIENNIKTICCCSEDISTVKNIFKNDFDLIKDNNIKFIVGDNLNEVYNNLKNQSFYIFETSKDRKPGLLHPKISLSRPVSKIIFGLCTKQNICIERSGNSGAYDFIKNLIYYRTSLPLNDILKISSYSYINDEDIINKYSIPHIFIIDNQINIKNIKRELNLSAFGFCVIDDLYNTSKDIMSIMKAESVSSTVSFYKSCPCGNTNLFFEFTPNYKKCICLQRNIARYKSKISLLDNGLSKIIIKNEEWSSKDRLEYNDYININNLINNFEKYTPKIEISISKEDENYIKIYLEDMNIRDNNFIRNIINSYINYEKYVSILEGVDRVTITKLNKQRLYYVIDMFRKDF